MLVKGASGVNWTDNKPVFTLQEPVPRPELVTPEIIKSTVLSFSVARFIDYFG